MAVAGFTAVVLFLAVPATTLWAQVNVPTWRYDNTHQGQNTQETILTPTNVNTNTFGKLFSQPVDGEVYAQPLYVSNLTINGATHNVLFVATEHDSVYAFDADTNGGPNSAPLWQASMLSAAHGAGSGATTVPSTDVQSGTGDIHPEIGITGTPVIDLATQTLFVLAKTKENGNYFQRLHAISILTGAERSGSPVSLTASVAGNGNGSSGGALAFSRLWQNNRVALDLFNGNIYLGFGSHGDDGPWHGWVLVYNETTLAQTAAICTSPNGNGDGIWSSGAAFPIDTVTANGRAFVVAGNGDFTTYPPLSNNVDFGESIMRYDLSNGGFAVSDAFTPFNQNALTGADLDQGSGGILLLPDQPGTYPHELVQVGKEGRILVLNRDALNGNVASSVGYNSNAVQDITGALKSDSGLWSTPAYWNGNVFMWASNDAMKMFPLTNGVLATTPSSLSSATSTFPGASPVVSSNGTQNGIVWAVRTDKYTSNGSSVLYAFNPANVAQEYYDSAQKSADDAGQAVKFVIPVVTNGKVYVGTWAQVDVYGLLNQTPQAPPPVISPLGGTYTAAQQITMTDSVSGSTIYYTTDGSTPSTNSTQYVTGGFPLTANATVKAFASATGYLLSTLATNTYAFSTQTPTPTFSPTPGTYTSAQSVTITDTLSNAVIYYTTDGSTPTTSSTLYSGAITVSSSTVINAIAVSSGLSNSLVATGSYLIQIPGTGINYSNGFASVSGLTLNGSATNVDDSRLQLTTGLTYQTGSVFYNTPTNIQAFTTDFTFQLSNAVADGFTFTIQNVSPTAIGGQGGGLGYGPDPTGAIGTGIGKSVAIKFDFFNNGGEGADSTGLFTNGTAPTVPAIDMTSSGVLLLSGDTMDAHMTYDGANLVLTLTDIVVNKVFTHTFPINIPSTIGSNTAYIGFTGASGGGTASQKILSWTLTSSAPTTPQAATPIFSPIAGTYAAAQSVTIADATPGAVIYYTTNGSAPTTASAVYAATAIPVAVSETLEAIAVATGYTQSAVATAAYVIQSRTATPTFSPVAGTYASAQSVTLADTTPGAVIYYTTNGSTPTTASAVYAATAIPVAASETLEAIAVATGYTQSAVATAAYVIQSTTTAPTFSPVAGTYTSAQSVTLTDAGATIYYTTNGSTPTTASAQYSTAIPVAGNTTVQAIALVPGSAQSAVASATYVIQASAPSTVNFAGGFPSAAGLQLNGNAKVNTNYLEITDGGMSEANSAFWTTPVNIQTFTTSFTFQINNANGDGFTFTLQNAGLTAVGSSGGGLGYGSAPSTGTGNSIGNSVAVKFDTHNNAGEGTDSTGVYINGAAPALPAVDLTSSGIQLASGDTMLAQLVYDGTTLTLNLTDTVTGSTFTHGFTLNIPATVGANTAYVGFTGGTGSSANVQNIETWTFSSTTTPTAAEPVLNPTPGTYATAQNVTLTATQGATIYYTVDGSTPTHASAIYSAPIVVNGVSLTIRAFASATGYLDSPIVLGAYQIQPATATPVISPITGTTFATTLNVSMTDTTANATIYYTTDGTTPTTASTLYAGAFNITASTSFKAIAVATGYAQSAVASAAYVVQSATATPSFTPTAGTYTAAQSVTISDTTPGAVIYYTTNGSAPTTASAVYGATAIPVATSETLQAIAVATGYTQSTVATAVFVIQSPAAAPSFTPTAGTYTSAQSVTIADTTPGAVIYYTTNGSAPTTASAVYGATAIPVAASATLKAIAVATGYTQSVAASAAYVIQSPAAAPSFTPTAGTYTSAQSVTITDTTAGAVIYYTTNGSAPTTASPVYGATAIPVAASGTLQAIAVATGYTQSVVATAAYVIQSPAATPSFTPAGGTYTSAQSVTISDTTAGAVIYYTTNGSTPTTASAVYGGTAIPVAASETLQAIAVATGYTQSAMASAAYVIQSPAAAPSFTPTAGTYTSAQSVTIADTTPAAVVYYTTNGSTPTTASAVYGNTAIPVAASETLKAIAVATGYSQSAVASAAYVIQTPAAIPSFAPAGGTYTSAQSVTIADTTPGAVIYYTTNGSAPTTASAVYGATAIPVAATETLQAIAVATGYTQSAVASAAYVIQSPAAAPSFTPTAGTYTSAQSVTIADTTPAAVIYYTTNGSTPTTASAVYGATAIPVAASETLKAIAVATGYTQSAVASAAYVIQSPAATPSFAPAGGTYTAAQSVTISDTTPGAVIYYTTNGSAPTTASPVYGGTAIPVAASETLEAIAVATGYNQSAVASAAYVIQSPAATPSFAPAGGTYTAAQSVTISDTTPGAVIYYTTNGSAPTTASAVYGATAIPVAASETLKAIAVATGYTQSAMATAAYVIQTPAATPSFTPAGGTYTSAQSVTISDTTPGAVIYYTTNGSAPTTASAVYGGTAIPIAASETLQAIAVATGYTQSATATAAYVIQYSAVPPSFTPTGGTYTLAQSVILADATPGAVIYYTTNGSAPTTASAVYGATAIPVAASETLQAIAVATGYTQSATATAAYVIQSTTTAPTFAPVAGTYTSAQSVTLTDAGAAIYYTTDGSTPTTASAQYSAAIPVTSNTTLQAIAVAPGSTPSAVASATYVVQSSTPSTVNFAGGFPSAAGLQLNGTSKVNANYLEITDGGTSEANSAFWTTPVNIQTFSTNFTFQINSAIGNGLTFTMQNAGLTAVGSLGGGLGYGSDPSKGTGVGIGNSVAVKFDIFNNIGEGTDSTGVYTNGAAPALPAVDLTSSGIKLSSGDTMSAQLVYDGTTLTLTLTDTVTGNTFTHAFPINIPATVGASTAYVGFTGGTGSSANVQNIKTWAFSSTLTPTAAAPVFNPTPGTYTTAQNVTLTAAQGATIYYTVDGSTPTHASAIYSTPIVVNAASLTIRAFASATGYQDSQIVAGAYQIQAAAVATPVISPTTGTTFASTLNVSMTDTTANAAIYYTTDGSTPTTASTLYAGAFNITASTSFKAIAVATGYTQSAVASAAYVLQSATTTAPTFSPVAGTYASAQSVTLTDAGATIYYTTDGSTPTIASAQYSAVIPVTSTTTVQAIAVVPGSTQSAVASATYVIQSSAPSTVTFAGGFPSAAGLQLNGAAKVNTNYLEITDGGTSESNSAFWTTPVNIQTFSTNFTFQINSAIGNGLTFTMQNAGLTAVGSLGGGLGYGSDPSKGTGVGIGNSVAVKFDIFNNIGEGTDSTGVYTNGAAPALPAVDLTSSGIKLSSGDTMLAQLVYDGTTLTLTLTDTVTGTTFTHAFTINIPATVGASTAYVGFTGGTGSSANIQNIKTWAFSSTTTPTAAGPVFNPTPGTYTTAQNVILTAAQGATIYYTVDGSTPTHASATYSTPVVVNAASLTIRAFASATGYQDSPIVVGAYQIQTAAATPVISPITGTTFASTLNVSMTDTTANATIYYTTDGTTPTTGSTVYAGAFNITASTSFKAIAVTTGYTQSAVASAAYVIQSATATPSFTPTGGTYTSAQSVTIADTTPGAVIYYTTNGSAPTTASAVYGATAIPVAASETLQAIAVATGYTQSAVASSAYVIQSATAAPSFTPTAGTYTSAQSVTIADTTPGAVIYYTTNGVAPTTASAVYGATAIPVAASETLQAIAVATGYTQSAVASAAYVIQSPAAAPSFTPAGGSYTSAQSVTLADTTPAAVIYYTTNGATPTTASPVYGNTAIPVAASATLKAIAVATGYTQSAVTTAAYVIQSPAAAPSFTPTGGTYTSAQSVTLADTTPAAVIYYTTNGATPTTASSVYGSTAIPVAASATLKAIAVATGYTQSAVTAAAYVIQSPAAAPSMTPAAGTYTSAQAVTLADTTPGAVIYYTTNGATPTTASSVYSAPIAVSANETINAIAAAPNYSASAVSAATYSFAAAPASVNLSSAYNTYGIFNSGSAPTNGGLDGSAYAYAGSTLPTGITLAGAPVTLGPVAAPDAIDNATVALPKGQYSSISVLAAASYGPQLNQTFVVTYSDATTSTFTQNMSDWGRPNNYSGETTVVTDPQRIIPSGALQAGPWYMYGYTFSLNSSKTVSSITLPATYDVFVFAMTLTP